MHAWQATQRTQASPRAKSGKVVSAHCTFCAMHRRVSARQLSLQLISRGNVEAAQVAGIILYFPALLAVYVHLCENL